jgi:hypothetical protein
MHGDSVAVGTGDIDHEAERNLRGGRSDLATLLRHVAAIIRLDGDSLSAMSEDGTQGLLIDYNADDERQTHEVTVWGERWSAAALACRLV